MKIIIYSNIFVSPLAVENRPCKQIRVPAEADWAVRSFHSACQSKIPHLTSEGEGGETSNQTGWETEPAVCRRVSQTHIHRHACSHIQMHEVSNYFQSSWSGMCRHGDLVWFISGPCSCVSVTAIVEQSRRRMRNSYLRAGRQLMFLFVLRSHHHVWINVFN